MKLVAVSKKFSADRLREAYLAGIRDFGESYVQEFADKKPLLSDLEGSRFHLIGHLQSNKTRLACDLFDVIETLDSPKTLRKIDNTLRERGRKMDVLVEVKLSDEVTKTGADPDDLPELLESAQSCTQIALVGLMTIPPWSKDAEQSRPYFQRLAELARRYHLKELSMGMSGDLEVAVEEGASIVRVGTALFGARPSPLPGIAPKPS